MTELAAKRASRERWLHAFMAVAIVVGTLAHLAYYFPRTVDDLFISLRYAENLARGNGAVYNGHERVEGYSGTLWMFLQALGYVLRIEGVTWTKLLGILCLLATQWGLYRATRDVAGVRPWLAWLPSVVFATNSYVGDQRKKYFNAPDAPVEDTKKTMRDVVIAWVREHGGFSPRGAPLPEPDDRTDPR